MTEGTKTPWHLWVVGIVSLLWNGFGANDYLQTQLSNRDYLGQMSESIGISVDDVVAYYDSYPAWADAFWALGVWGSVLGSLLLLLRIRFAAHAFAASLIGLVVSMGYQITHPVPGMTDSSFAVIFTAVIFVIISALIYYARRMTAAGVLR